MTISATKLRSNLYRVIEGVIKNGVPVEVELHGRKVFIVPAETPDKLANLTKRTGVIVGGSARLPLQKTFDEKRWLKKWDKRLK